MKNLKDLIPAIGWIVAALAMTPLHSALASEDMREVSVEAAMARSGVTGASVVLIENHRIVWAKGFGVRGPDGEPVTPRTEFEAASNGKMAGAYVVMQLIEEGVLTLDTPLEDARLMIPESCTAPTVSQALSHTTGLGNDLGADSLEPACDPGHTFSYAGQGYMVLQAMLEQQTGSLIADLMAARLFKPLGLSSAGFEPKGTPEFATGHTDLVFGLITSRASAAKLNLARGIGIIFSGLFLFAAWRMFRRFHLLVAIPAVLVTAPVFVAIFVLGLAHITTPISRTLGQPDLASSLQLNAVDLAGFALELMDPDLVSTRTRDVMFTRQVKINERIAWANGIGIDRSDGHTTYWHWGSNPGFQSLFVIEPETGKGIIIMANAGGFLDYYSTGKGGYNMSKALARELLRIDGAWDLRGYRK